MKSNTQNAKIEAITEKTLVLGIDVGIRIPSAGLSINSARIVSSCICSMIPPKSAIHLVIRK